MEGVQLLGSVCSLGSFLFQMIGLRICYDVINKGSCGDMSPFTFISMFVACAVWLKYSIMQKNAVLIAVNVYGTVLNLIYIFVFYRYSSKKGQFHQYLMIGVFMLISPLLYVNYYQVDMLLATSHLGTYCVALSVIGYASPLTSLADVIRSKSTASLSFLLIFANFILAIIWTIYGGMIGDRYVQAPNMLGGMFALVQLSLFLIYPSKPRSRVLQS